MRESLMGEPAGEEDVLQPQTAGCGVRMFSLPLPGDAAADQQVEWRLLTSLAPVSASHLCHRLQQQGQALEGQKPAGEQQQRLVLACPLLKGMQVRSLVADGASDAALVPSLRRPHQEILQEARLRLP